jgi:hypothetical protein
MSQGLGALDLCEHEASSKNLCERKASSDILWTARNIYPQVNIGQQVVYLKWHGHTMAATIGWRARNDAFT